MYKPWVRTKHGRVWHKRLPRIRKGQWDHIAYCGFWIGELMEGDMDANEPHGRWPVCKKCQKAIEKED